MKNFIFIVGFFFMLSQVVSAQVKLVKVDSLYSPSVELQLKYTVILPENYEEDSQTDFPLMLLLHGHTGNYTSWLSYANFHTELATRFQTIVVLPDGGNSWYVNWSGQTDGKPHRWEDMITKDLLKDIDKKYRIKKGKNATAIGGLSMGGYGALAVGLRNPDIFGSVFSISGAIDFTRNIKREFERDTLDWNSPMLWSNGEKSIDSPGFSTQQERTPKGLVFKTPKHAVDHDPYQILAQTEANALPYVTIICGLNDYFIKDARTFRGSLEDKGIPYSYIEMPGGHEVPFWEHAIELVFPLLQNHNKNRISTED